MTARRAARRSQLPAERQSPAGYSCFFDVDETLVTVKTMASFLEFYLAETSAPSTSFTAALAYVTAAGQHGRAAANRAYYRLFAGADADEVARIGVRWFAARNDQHLFNAPVVDALGRHLDDGARVVLVSGAFSAILTPVAAWCGATAVLCSVPEIDGGRYTGGSERTMIGEEKAHAVRSAAAETGHRLAGCWAYGDDLTDLAMLEAVGHPVVVQSPVEVHGNVELVAQARRRGWHVLPATTSRSHDGLRAAGDTGSAPAPAIASAPDGQ
ncbi:HAD family hydrolase [uncultured Jatrophihabitans sp.]|uniref:HAD family hydrolase n=1 Tax=uncultured Jatrophihabitans sp. TaxID=1610747 RepID=UPI0035CA5BBD